jgi:hypothetical protein
MSWHLAEKGPRGYENEVAACRLCNNSRRSDIEAVEFYHWRLEHRSQDSAEIQKLLSKYRRKKNRLSATERKDLIYRDRLLRALHEPYVYRMVSVANRQFVRFAFDAARYVLDKLGCKYLPPVKDAGTIESSGNRSRSKGRNSRARHKRKEPVGNRNAACPAKERQERVQRPADRSHPPGDQA